MTETRSAGRHRGDLSFNIVADCRMWIISQPENSRQHRSFRLQYYTVSQNEIADISRYRTDRESEMDKEPWKKTKK